ncbi:hypothetical protein BDF14DRAFT_1794549 [Spinellus fusiger]|nr:hypothetical protein BDF14DRAFT_1794549 [Spinellus fusiger]
MADVPVDEVLFVIMMVIVFFLVIISLVCLFNRVTRPSQRQVEEEAMAQLQWVTASQQEAMRPSLLKQLYAQPAPVSSKRGSVMEKLRPPTKSNSRASQLARPLSQLMVNEKVTRPSSVRQPSFKPMQYTVHPHSNVPSIIVNEDPNLVKPMLYTVPPPAYGDHRASMPVRCDDTPFGYTGKTTRS